jgi:hypothetical protein
MKVLAVHDGSVLRGDLQPAERLAEHRARQRRPQPAALALLETNAADLSFLFTLDQGEPVSPHLQKEALAVFETPHHTPYAFNLHVQDVGHTLVLGATGSGKSFL